MKIPSIWAQPIDGLTNFEMSGDDLTASLHFLQIAEENESGLGASAKNTTETATATTSFRRTK